MVTSHDVARAAGVSQATVSRVLAGGDRVTPATAERVRAAMLEVGYVPNVAARTMKTGRTATIGVVVADITNPFYPELLDALSTALAAAGQRMILWNEPGTGEDSAVQAIRGQLVDGVVFTTATRKSAALHAALARNWPVVLVNRGVPRLACDQVTSDNVGGGRAVAAYLAECGHRRLGLITGPDLPSTAVERKRGFLAGLASAGLPEPIVAPGDFTHAGAWRAAHDLLTGKRPPSAIFGVNDLTAFGAVDAARALGRDVAIVGYDDVAMAAWESYDLTTVRQPTGEMAAVAVELLLDRIAEPTRPPVRRRFPTELIVRGSTNRSART